MQKQTLTILTLFVLFSTLCAENRELIFSFDGETGKKPSQFTKERRWITGGDDDAGTVEIVKANDHANGGKALKITKKRGVSKFNRLRVYTKNQNFKPNAVYLVSGWFKADRKGLAQIQLTSPWAKNKKPWFKAVNFLVDNNWKRYSFEFHVPKATPGSTLEDEKLYLIFGLYQESLNELYAKDLVWEKKS